MLDAFYRWLVRLFPLQLLYWAANEAAARVTSGKFYGNSDPNEVSIMEMLRRLLLELKRKKQDSDAIRSQNRISQGLCGKCEKPMVTGMLDCPNCEAPYDGKNRSSTQRGC